MARHFKEADIAEFRDCFSLYARNGFIENVEKLSVIMRSLRTSPTLSELKLYMKSKNGKMSFADFLEVMHTHTLKEKSTIEIQKAFKAADPDGRGKMSAKELRHILSGWGEKLSVREVDALFREAHIKPSGSFHYGDFIRVVTGPVPDY